MIFIKEGDTPARKSSLGALQKLSLRKNAQIIMIEQDMIKWIVHTLTEVDIDLIKGERNNF